MMSEIDPWEAARAQFVNDLSAEEHKLFETTTLDNLLESTIAAEQGHQQQSYSRRVSKKLEPLVDAIAQYGKVLDVFSSTYSIAMAPLWGSIRVLLHIAQSFEKYFQKLVDMLERIGDVLPRCQTYQNLFPSNTRLLQLISVAYVDIIHFCWTVKKAFRKMKKSTTDADLHAACWTLKLCWKDVNKEFEEKVDAFRNHVKSVEKEANLLSMVETHEGWSVAASARKLKRKQRILSLLSDIKYTAKHQDERQKRHPGSGSWFIETHEYKNWERGAQSQCLWCYGIPGSGKTVLMSSVVDTFSEKILERQISEPVASPRELGNEKTAGARPAVIYHYCEFSDLRSLEPTIILGTLIRQLLEIITIPEELCQQIEQYFTPRSRKVMPEELFAVLQDALLKYSEIYILIDGLDECHTNDIHVLLSLFNSLFQLDHCSSIFKMIIFSRQIGAVPQVLTHYTSFEVSIDRITLDIDNYIESTVRSQISHRKLEVSDTLLEKEIIETLKEGARGMFLWVHFQLLDLCDAASVRELRATLHNLPNGIIETYTRILEKISTSRTKITLAQQVFKWIICAKRPMSLAELAEAVAFSYTDSSWSEEKIPKPSRLYEACRNLIVRNEEDDTVRLAHHTFKQLLLEQPQHQVVGAFHIPLPEADIEVGEICVAYLSFSDFESQVTVSNRQALPFSCMPAPMRIMEQVIFPSKLNNVATSILQARNYLRPRNSLSQSLDFELMKFAKLRIPPSHELRDKYALLDYVIRYWIGHTSAFHWRRTRMWKSFRRLALDKHLPFDVRPWGDINERKKNTYEGLIQWAVNAEHLPLLQLLPIGCSITDAIVVQAIRKDSLPLVEVLTMKGANPNARSENGITTLQWAALRGHITSLELLVSLGAAIEAHGPDGRTALNLAARNGLTPSVAHLIRMNANIDAKDYHGDTALLLSASQGHESTVEVLLAKGADIEAKDDNGYTPLLAAVREGHESMVEALLAKGADIEAKNYSEYTTLHLAVTQGYEIMVELLLAKGADIEVKNGIGNTALHLAVDRGRESTVKALLEKGADSAAKNSLGKTVLHLAVHRSCESTVGALLGKGADIEAKDNSGYTALHLAVDRGCESMVDVLLGKGADIEVKDSIGNTALHLAAGQGYNSMVELLLAKGPDIEARDDRGYTALHIAAKLDLKRTVEILLFNGADIEAKDSEGNTVLLLVALLGRVSMVNFLLAKAADINAKDRSGDTVLHKAAREDNIMLVAILIVHGANLETRNNYEKAALDLAVVTETVTLLKATPGFRRKMGRSLEYDLLSQEERIRVLLDEAFGEHKGRSYYNVLRHFKVMENDTDS